MGLNALPSVLIYEIIFFTLFIMYALEGIIVCLFIWFTVINCINPIFYLS